MFVTQRGDVFVTQRGDVLAGVPVLRIVSFHCSSSMAEDHISDGVFPVCAPQLSDV